MARPKGIDHFLKYLSGLEDQYVVIGGGAAAILMDEQNLEFRKTVDVDLVLLTHGSPELNAKIGAYVEEGKYEKKEATQGSPRYYRFRNPDVEGFPRIIEIFASNEQDIPLREGQYIIPVQSDEVAQLSAILLDDEYFALIKANSKRATNNASVITAPANICLKARAHRELSERKAQGGDVDEKDIKKHANDILRLSVMLTGQEKIELGPQAMKDLQRILEILEAMPDSQFKQVTKEYGTFVKKDLLLLIRKVFSA